MKPANTREEIERLFNVPITEAAKKLGISTTLLKKRCRALGIMSWPYKKLKKQATEAGLDHSPITYKFREWKPKSSKNIKRRPDSISNEVTGHSSPEAGEMEETDANANVVCLLDGTILSVSNSARLCLGYGSQELTNVHLQYLLHPKNLRSFNFTLLQCLAGYREINLTLKLQKSNLGFVEVSGKLCIASESVNKVAETVVFNFNAPVTEVLNNEDEYAQSQREPSTSLDRFRIPEFEVAESLANLEKMEFEAALLWLLQRLYGSTSFVSERTFKHSWLAKADVAFPMSDPLPAMFTDPWGKILWSNNTYNLVTGYNHQGEYLANIDSLRDTGAETLARLLRTDLPQLLDCQTPVLPTPRCGIKRCGRGMGWRLDTPQFAQRVEANKANYNGPQQHTHTLLPTCSDVYGYLLLMYFLLLEPMDDTDLTPSAKLIQTCILRKVEEAKEERIRFSA